MRATGKMAERRGNDSNTVSNVLVLVLRALTMPVDDAIKRLTKALYHRVVKYGLVLRGFDQEAKVGSLDLSVRERVDAASLHLRLVQAKERVLEKI